MIFTTPIQKRVHDFGANGNMSPSALLEIFETVADLHSDAIHDANETGIVWILSEWRVEVCESPTAADKLFADTYIIRGNSRMISDRAFILKNADGKILARAVASIVQFDLAASRMVRLNLPQLERYKPEDKPLFDTRLPRFSVPETFDTVCPLTVRKSDIDGNGHVHNTIYPALAAEVFPTGTPKSYDFRIVYHNAIRYEDTATVKSHTGEDGTQNIVIYAGDRPATFLCVTPHAGK